MQPTPRLRCFYCKQPFGGDPREDLPDGASCPHCKETPVMFEFEDDK